MQQAWDKNGRIYYIDDNGNRVQPKSTKNAFERLGMQAKAGLGNLNRWLQNADTNSQSYKDKVNVALGLLTAPIGGSSALAAKGAGALTPFVGRKIAQSVASNAVGGATGSAVEGFGRGLIENKNPLQTMLQDSALGLVGGGALGGVVGKAGQVLAKRGLPNNPVAPEQYFADYVEGLSNNTPINKVSRFQKALGDFKMAREGNSVAGTGTLFDILKDSNGNYLKLLHGTSGKFDNFDKSKLGSLTGAKSAKQGFWFTDGEKTAQSYADYSAENSELNKLLRKQQAMEKMPLVNWDEYDKLTEEIENIALNPQPEPRIIKAHLDMNNPASFDAKGKRFMEIQEDINNFIESNRNADGFIINNLRDAVNPNVIDEAATHYMVREPDQIKIIKDDVTPNLYDKLVDNYNPEIEQIPKGHIRLYRGLQEEFNPNYDKSKLDNVNGYESWTDNYDLAKAYGDNVYYIDLPESTITRSIIDENPKSMTYGDRNLIYEHDKPVGIKGKNGKEYMLYTYHENYPEIKYNKFNQ